MEILVTGYEPFGTTPVNPAQGVARALDGGVIAGATIVGRIVPCVFFRCIEVVREAIDALRPDAVIMMGEYGGRSLITVERIAQNLNDGTRYDLADNQGASPQGQLTVPGGPAACYATLPIRAMVRAMRNAGIPADISDAPGTFCCNHLMYGILHYIAEASLPIRAGWVHLPQLPSVAALDDHIGTPSMSLETSVAGLTAAIGAIVEHADDVDVPIRSTWQL